MSDKTKHLYSEREELEIFYTYDEKYRKVYDLKNIKRKFKLIINRLKQNNED
jgi:hypothetical protein